MELLASCATCKHEFEDNVAILTAGDAGLTDQQVAWVLMHLTAQHKEH